MQQQQTVDLATLNKCKERGVAVKYCSGESCERWLPVSRFGSNVNMADGFDLYCIDCNKRKRDSRAKARELFRERNQPGEKIDAFEQYVHDHASKPDRGFMRWPFLAFEGAMTDTPESRIMRKIESAMLEAKLRFKRPITISRQSVYDTLFAKGGAYYCTINRREMTPQCFEQHHAITFDAKEREVSVVCSDCISAFVLHDICEKTRKMPETVLQELVHDRAHFLENADVPRSSTNGI